MLLYNCNNNYTSQYPKPTGADKDGRFYSKQGLFEFGDKEYKADYLTITVKENRRSNTSRFIHLPVLRIHAINENQNEPIFCLTGGPGMSNMIDGSVVLDCPEVAAAFENSREDLLNEKSLKTIGEAWTESFTKLKLSDIDLRGYTILETIKDILAAEFIFPEDIMIEIKK